MKRWVIIASIIFFSCKASIHFPEGGYNYPEKINNRDTGFLCYPLIDSLSRKDSFETAFYGKYVLTAFNEPNLSLRPLEEPIFRLIYDSWYEQTIITLTQNKIIIKEGKSGLAYPIDEDTSKLSSLENYHYRILRWNFPLEATSKSRFPSFFDSITQRYPELLNPDYFKYLTEKVKVPGKESFKYSSKVIHVSNHTFAYLVNLINSSGFWTMPHHVRCEYIDTDAAGFSLEANTSKKYKIVFAVDCFDDHSKFKIACQELVKNAKLDQKIHLVWDSTSETTDSASYMIDSAGAIMKK